MCGIAGFSLFHHQEGGTEALEAMGHKVDLLSTRMPPSGLIAHDWSEDAIARTTYLGQIKPLNALRALSGLLPRGLMRA